MWVYVYRRVNDGERGVNEKTGDRNDNVINRDPIKGRGISSTHTVGVVRQRVYTLYKRIPYKLGVVIIIIIIIIMTTVDDDNNTRNDNNKTVRTNNGRGGRQV